MPGPYRCTDTPSITLPLSLRANFSLQRDVPAPRVISAVPICHFIETRGRRAAVSGLSAVTARRDGSLLRWQLGGKRQDCDSYGAPEHPQGRGSGASPLLPAAPACQTSQTAPHEGVGLRRSPDSLKQNLHSISWLEQGRGGRGAGTDSSRSCLTCAGQPRAGGAGWGRVQQAQQEPAPRSLAR